jgi:hypothetical protein
MVPGFIKTKVKKPENLTFDNLDEAGIDKKTFSPLVDLGAFDLQKIRDGNADFSKLAEEGVKEIVLMEDRDPMFYLNYNGYDPRKEVPLNRHGAKNERWLMEDMKKLIELLHKAGIKVVMGFWGNSGNHEGNAFINRNWENLKPVIPLSDDINPLSFVKDNEDHEMPFADYVVRQYAKIKRDFHVDGLFLGDGLMGYRSFLDSQGPYDLEDTAPLWTDFYRRIHKGIKEQGDNDTLWAYDCMGNGTEKILRNGVDLKALAPHIDNYIFQAYGSDAWGKNYMRLPGYDLQRDTREASTLPPSLKVKTRYTVGLGDSVEGWIGRRADIKAKHALLERNAHKGTLGVWSNEIVRRLNG